MSIIEERGGNGKRFFFRESLGRLEAGSEGEFCDGGWHFGTFEFAGDEGLAEVEFDEGGEDAGAQKFVTESDVGNKSCKGKVCFLGFKEVRCVASFAPAHACTGIEACVVEWLEVVEVGDFGDCPGDEFFGACPAGAFAVVEGDINA